MNRFSQNQRVLTRRVFLKYLLTRGITDFRQPKRNPTAPPIETLLIGRSDSSALFHLPFFPEGIDEMIFPHNNNGGQTLQPASLNPGRRLFLLFSVEVWRSILSKRLGLPNEEAQSTVDTIIF